MGFHVKCSGSELLRELSQDAFSFIGQPYALYVIALATSIDDDVLKWLYEYEMAVDSVTGDIAAFFLFYNEAILKTTNLIREEYPEYHKSAPANIEKILIDGNILRRGWEYVHDYLNDNKSSLKPDGGKVKAFSPNNQTDYNVFLRSMTYESDDIARELGILDQLPCLLFISNSSRSDFHIMQLDKPNQSILRTIRDLLSEFINDETYSDYFKHLRRWHDLYNEKKYIIQNIQELIPNYGKYDPCKDNCTSLTIDAQFIFFFFLSEARELLFTQRPKSFYQTLIRIADLIKHTEKLDHHYIKYTTHRINLALILSSKLCKQSSINESHNPSFKRILNTSRNILQVPLEIGEGMSPQEISASLKDYALHEIENLFTQVIQALDLPFQSFEHLQKLAASENELDYLTNVLEGIDKPKFSSVLKKYKRRKSYKQFFCTVTKGASDITKKSTPVITLIKKAISLLS